MATAIFILLKTFVHLKTINAIFAKANYNYSKGSAKCLKLFGNSKKSNAVRPGGSRAVRPARASIKLLKLCKSPLCETHNGLPPGRTVLLFQRNDNYEKMSAM
jgi:hypothetical protein